MITIIAAIGRNNELGKNNKLIWMLPNDLTFFKQQTKDSVIAMGKNTFNSLPTLLPGRKHVILSTNEYFNKDTTGVLIFNNKDEFINYCINCKDKIFIIGGASIYSMFVDIADVLILTEIDAEDKEAQVYFPKLDRNKYKKEVLDSNSDNGINYVHVKYTKI
jgi:dihydrofolate reductase